jgi:hypothetical protein
MRLRRVLGFEMKHTALIVTKILRLMPSRQSALVAVTCIVTACATPVQAVPVFYLSNQASGAGPDLLTLTDVQPGTNGSIQLWGTSDIPLANVSLDLVETGGAIRFTGVEVANPQGPPPRWAFLDFPQFVNNRSITSIGGGVIPGVAGDGVGAGTAAGENVLLATINYLALARRTSTLSLRIGANRILDFNAGSPMVRFGSTDAPLINGAMVGASGAVGSIAVNGGALPVVVDRNLGDRPQGSYVQHRFTTLIGDRPVTWGNLSVGGPGAPAIAPTLTSDGMFSWNSATSPPGLYNFDVTATNQWGTDVGRLAVNLLPVPVPVFYVSNQSAQAAPGLLDLSIPPNSSGTLHIWADTDVHLVGISLDLVETGGAINFTGLSVHNPNVRWSWLDGPQEVTNSAVNNIGGQVSPGGLAGNGIGPGTLDGTRILLASVAYTASNTSGAKSDLSLRVGSSGIAEYTGAFAQVRFGTQNGLLHRGDQIGASGFVGSITIVPEPTTALLAGVATIVVHCLVRRNRTVMREGTT